MRSRKLVWLVCALLISSIMFSACSKQTDTTSQSQSTAPSTAGEVQPIVKEKITLKFLIPTGTDFVVSNDMPVIAELEKMTNVHLEFELLPTKNASERFTAAMAAREPFDMVCWLAMPDINKYGMEGVFIPVQDLIKQHAPNLKKGLDNPLEKDVMPYKQNAWAECTAPDGKMYNIPAISSANAVGRVYAIREDWLKKLNLKVPETADQLYDVLKAFKNNDPNSNGQSDEVPLGAKSTGYASIMPLINAFGAHNFLYVDPKDDTIKFGPVDKSWKEGMTYINRLFKEGLLDKEYLSSKADKWTALVSANKLGMMLEWPMSGIGNANNELKKIDPSYKFVPILPMKAPDGRRYVDASTTGSIVLPRVAITATNKHPVETIKFLDFLYSDAGTELAAYGVKGMHYNIVNGKPVYSEKITKNPDGLNPDMARRKEGINYYFLPFQLGWDSQFQVMESPSPDVVASWSLYRQPGTIEARMPTLNFTDAEKAQETAMAEIIKFVTAKYNPFAVGEEPLDKYDDFVAQIKKMGLDEALKTYNAAYQRYKKYAN